MSLYHRLKRSRKARLAVRLRPGKVIGFDGAPVARGQAAMLADLRHNGAHFVVSSSDRRKGVAERFGKMSQAALYGCYLSFRATGHCPSACHGNCNPANPPGRSTHERRSDGVPYRGPIGRRLKWWGTGIDLGNAAAAEEAIQVARRLGYDLFRPYSDPREAHHVNLRKNPLKNLIRRGLAASVLPKRRTK